MLIEIESAYGDQIISGKMMDENALKNIVTELLAGGEAQAFVAAFCARCGYKATESAGGVPVDYIIDLDTHLIIKPTY